MKRARYTEFLLRPRDGGRLITTQVPENVGPENYVEKTGWRRVDDCEQIRESFEQAFAFYDTSGHGHILNIWEAQRPNGDRAIVVATATEILRLNVDSVQVLGSGYSATWWDAESMDGYLILNNSVDLPVYYRVEDSAVVPLYELREIGVASVGSICVTNGFLMFGDTRMISSTDQANWMNGASPYGKYTGTTNDIGFQIIWSDFGKPTNWSPVIIGTIQSASKNQVTLQWPSQTFKVGGKLAVVGAGPNGGILGGQTEIPDGVPVTDVSGNVLTLQVPADAALVYPLTVSVTRWADTSTFSGSSKIQDDGSSITAIKPLKQLVVVYRKTGIFTGRFTGEVETPFIFSPAYRGYDVPEYPRCISSVNGDYHVYPTRNRFCYFDGAGAPQVHRTLDDARTVFFDHASGTLPFSVENFETKEMWFITGHDPLAYDYHTDTASVVPFQVTTARQTSTGFVAVRAYVSTSLLYRQVVSGSYGHYAGAPTGGALAFGKGALGDHHDQKVLRGYGVLLGEGQSSQNSLTVFLRGRDVSHAPDELLSILQWPPIVGSSDLGAQWETYYRNTYFNDRVMLYPGLVSSKTRMYGRLFKFQVKDTRAATHA